MKITTFFYSEEENKNEIPTNVILHLSNGENIYIKENEHFSNMINIKTESNYNMGVYPVGINHICIEVGEDNQ